MSYLEGNPNKQKSIEIREFNPPSIDIVNDYAVPIKEGYVIIKVGEGTGALYVKQKVVRIKNVGATNKIIRPNTIHKEIMGWFRSQPIRARYSVKAAVNGINHDRQASAEKFLDFSTVQGRISELLYHKVLELIHEGGENYYVLDRSRAEQVLTRNSFAWRDSDQ